METSKPPTNVVFFLFSIFIFAELLTIEGFAIHSELPHSQGVSHSYPSQRERHFQINGDGEWRDREYSRRVMIGSTMPTCTYNECRGCKHKCGAKQIPVDGNDPINSAYHYKCVCHT